MRNYTPTPGFEEAGSGAGGNKKKPRRTVKKDPDAPKRPRTAYILFSTDYRYAALTVPTEILAEGPIKAEQGYQSFPGGESLGLIHTPGSWLRLKYVCTAASLGLRS